MSEKIRVLLNEEEVDQKIREIGEQISKGRFCEQIG